MINKRRTSLLIPYRFVDGVPQVYLQRRTKDAPRRPAYLGFFGGGEEPIDQSPEQTLLREAYEELCVIIFGYEPFLVWEDDRRQLHVFSLLVPYDWEHIVMVEEGDYGRFYSEEEVLAEPLVVPLLLEMLKMFFTSVRVPPLSVT